MTAADSELESISDKKVVDRYLQYAMELREVVSCLVENGSFRFDCQLISHAGIALELEMIAESASQLTAEQFKILDSLPENIRLSFSVNGVLFFASASLSSRESSKLIAGLKMPLHKLQRRDALRLNILNEHKATITIDGKAYIPHDLSATGLSFVIMPDEEALFPLRRMLQSCKLKFAGMEAFVNLEVMSVARLHKENERLLKVGMRFMGLSPAVEQRLAREAYLYTHKIWSRRL